MRASNVVTFDDQKLRKALKKKKLTQRALAQQVGTTHFNVSRWCSAGRKRTANLESVEAVAQALGVSVRDLIEPHRLSPRAPVGDLTEAELDWVQVWRKLTPLGQAKARVLIDDMMQSNDDLTRS